MSFVGLLLLLLLSKQRGFSLHHRHRPLCIPRCGQNLQLTYRKGRVGRYGLYLLSPLRGIEMSLSRFLIQEPFHVIFIFCMCTNNSGGRILTENWVLFEKEFLSFPSFLVDKFFIDPAALKRKRGGDRRGNRPENGTRFVKKKRRKGGFFALLPHPPFPTKKRVPRKKKEKVANHDTSISRRHLVAASFISFFPRKNRVSI